MKRDENSVKVYLLRVEYTMYPHLYRYLLLSMNLPVSDGSEIRNTCFRFVLFLN